MRSINFPAMQNQHAIIVQGREAIYQGLWLLLNTRCGELWCDPAWGCNISNRLFDPADRVTEIIMIDDILSSIRAFAQYVQVNRDGISIIERTQGRVKIRIEGTSLLDFQTNMYDIEILR
jgi:phage baseplate assembly protein W